MLLISPVPWGSRCPFQTRHRESGTGGDGWADRFAFIDHGRNPRAEDSLKIDRVDSVPVFHTPVSFGVRDFGIPDGDERRRRE